MRVIVQQLLSHYDNDPTHVSREVGKFFIASRKLVQIMRCPARDLGLISLDSHDLALIPGFAQVAHRSQSVCLTLCGSGIKDAFKRDSIFSHSVI